jgi:hypothetical protein
VTSRPTHLLTEGIPECYPKGMGEHPDALATARRRARRRSGNVEVAEGEIRPRLAPSSHAEQCTGKRMCQRSSAQDGASRGQVVAVQCTAMRATAMPTRRSRVERGRREEGMSGRARATAVCGVYSNANAGRRRHVVTTRR